MKLSIEESETIEAIVDDLGGELRTDYSGRGMYDKGCLGIVVEERPIKFIIELIEALADESRDEIIHAMSRSASQDSMGRGTIIYFPDIEWPKEDGEEDGE